MLSHIAIIGAGLVGRVLTLSLLKHFPDITIDLYDKVPDLDNQTSCGRIAGGMVAPWAELATNEPILHDMGKQSLALWPQLLSPFSPAISEKIFHNNGTIIIAHPSDGSDLDFLAVRIKQHSDDNGLIGKSTLTQLEPQLRAEKLYHHSLHFPNEAHIHVENFYLHTNQFFHQHNNIHYHYIDDSEFPDASDYDHLFDTRGLGAKKAISNLYGTRGEAIIIHAPAVNFTHCLRLVHPRHALYIIPRGNHQYYVGATTIDSEDCSPISIKSLLEIMSSLYFVHEGFSEARLIKTIAHCRPTLPGALPTFTSENNITRLNGFYRHGYLLAPTICQQLLKQQPFTRNREIMENSAS